MNPKAGAGEDCTGDCMPTCEPFVIAPPLPPPKLVPLNIDTKSSNGLLDVPARRFAAAGVDVKVVAARPEG